MSKIFKTPNGLELAQLATFTHYLKGRQFRFVVTQEHPALPICVTHRLSGFRVCNVSPLQLAASRGDAKSAGQAALIKLLAEKTEDRVHDVISRAEDMGYAV